MEAFPVNMIRLLGWVYAVLFVAVVAVGYVPAFVDDQGYVFGLFSIQIWDDLLHLGSGIWAAAAAWTSTRATVLYFRIFGILYGLDGVLGLLTGQGYLDGGIFIHGPTALDLSTRIFANAPHILIGGIAVIIGFGLSSRLARESYA
jgi:hypothetical protein